MSAVLGHIHFWLYKKIQLIAEREQIIKKEAQTRLDDLADELYATAIDLYGKPIPPDRQLDRIIDHNNIHGWLHNQLQTSSVREATFIKDLTDCGGDDGIDAVLEAFIKQGAMCGTEAKEKLTAQTAPAIYTVMQDYYVNGMPCDPSDTVIEQTDTTFSWYGNHQNQISYWKTAGVSPIIMAAAFQAWFSAFVSHVAPDFAFNVNLDGDIPVYTIAKS